MYFLCKMASYRMVFSLIFLLSYFCFLCGINGRSDFTARYHGNRETNLEDIVHRYRFCHYCKVAVNLINKYVSSNSTFSIFRQPAIKICTEIIDYAGYTGSDVCPGLVNTYGPVVLYILTKRSLSDLSVCTRLNFCPPDAKNMNNIDLQFMKWKNISPRLVTGSEAWRAHAHRRTQKKVDTTERKNSIRILQITDLHVDKLYKKGTSTSCGTFLCCRKDSKGNGTAGKYGEENCDIPPVTANIILNAVKRLSPPPDFVIYTGDSPPHDVWQSTPKQITHRSRNVIHLLARKLSKFKVYPTIGNHDTFPQNLYYQPLPAFQKTTKRFSVWWRKLFDIPEDQAHNIQYSGYYTVLVRHGLRILSFNTDYGYTLNFYTLLNKYSLAYYEQMSFMENVLLTARMNREKVIIIGHIPPGDLSSATFTYGDFYTDLVIRYSDVIVLQLFGHTHFDQFQLVSDMDNPENVYGTVFVSPAVTTYSGNNPAFRMYHLHPSTYELMDYDQYFINLTAANEIGDKRVRMLYSAMDEYGLKDLSPMSFYNLSERFWTDDELFQRYYNNIYVKSGKAGPCDLICKLLAICEVKSSSVRTLIRCILDYRDKNLEVFNQT